MAKLGATRIVGTYRFGNMLALLDSLDKFETIIDGDIVMRLHPEEAAVMREQALPLSSHSAPRTGRRRS